jgi:hypothetical protein
MGVDPAKGTQETSSFLIFATRVASAVARGSSRVRRRGERS